MLTCWSIGSYSSRSLVFLSRLSTNRLLGKGNPHQACPDLEWGMKAQPHSLILCTGPLGDAFWFLKPTLSLDSSFPRASTSQDPWSVSEQDFPGGPGCRARLFLLWPFMRDRWLPIDLDSEDQPSCVRITQVSYQTTSSWTRAVPQCDWCAGVTCQPTNVHGPARTKHWWQSGRMQAEDHCEPAELFYVSKEHSIGP